MLTLVVGLVPACVLARYRFPARRLLSRLLVAAFVLPTVVIGAAILALLPPVERGVPAILVAHVCSTSPSSSAPSARVWDHLPPDLEAAAATLGASPWRAFREVTLPLLRPAILAAASIVFVFTFTSYGVIRVLGEAGPSTIEVEIWRRATQLGDIGAAATLAVAATGGVGAAVVWASRQQRAQPGAGPAPARPGGAAPRRAAAPLRRRRRRTTAVAVAAPLVALVERSLRAGGRLHAGRMAQPRPDRDAARHPRRRRPARRARSRRCARGRRHGDRA